MAGQLPPITPPSLPAKPDGLLARLWNAAFPSSQIPEQPAVHESMCFRMVFRPWSLPARIAVFVAVVLVAIVSFCLWEFSTNPYHVPWRYSLTSSRVISVFLLVLVIPLSVFQALKLWLHVDQTPFPDINAAWKAGIEALRKQGLTLGDKPLFLVLGAVGEEQERAMFESSNSALLVGVPEGPAPLHWYVDADRIFLSCTGAGWLTALSALIDQREKSHATASGGGAFNEGFGSDDDSASIRYNPGGSSGKQMPVFTDDARKSISFDDLARQTNPSGAFSDVKAELAAEQPSAAPPQERALAIIQPSDIAEQVDRLEAVCELLWAARYPYSPINSCITLIPFSAAGAGEQEIEEMAKAIKSDLQTLYKMLRVRYPVFAIFTGMEAEPGFRELMRRVGPERCAMNRFGMGYDLRSPASAGEIGSFAAHVCGVFEEWVYGLFREDQALKRPGNSSLFSLLCRVRSNFKDRLSILLSQGFGYSDRLDPDEVPYLFSGCYFVASGASRDKQAFIRGISEKLDGEQDRLEWSRAAIRQARRTQRLATGAIAMVGVLTILLISLLIFHPIWGH